MIPLRERVVRLAASDAELKPHLDRLLMANRSDFVRETMMALDGWEPRLSSNTLGVQLGLWLSTRPGWVTAARADMRDAHRQEFESDWADWIFQAVKKWAKANAGTKGLDVLPRRIDYNQVVSTVLRKLGSREEPSSGGPNWMQIERDLQRLRNAIEARSVGEATQLARILANRLSK